jgi:hypothetical protein
MRRALAGIALAFVPFASAPAPAHEVDEYVQAALISVEKDHLDIQLRLVPGAAVFAKVIAAIDTDADGAISPAEQQTYTHRLVEDIVLTLNGQRATPAIEATSFPSVELMKEGLGEIHIALRVPVLMRTGEQKLVLQNRHQNAISAYLVNCLAPRDPSLKIIRQRRSVDQAHYELEYMQGTF